MNTGITLATYTESLASHEKHFTTIHLEYGTTNLGSIEVVTGVSSGIMSSIEVDERPVVSLGLSISLLSQVFVW